MASLARLLPDRPALGVRAHALSGDLLGTGEGGASGTDEAGLRCPVGADCLLSVRQLRGTGYANGAAFTLELLPAQAVPELAVSIPGQVKDLLVRGDLVYAAGTTGVRVLEPATLTALGTAAVRPARGLAACGRYLCAVKGGVSELVVLDVAEATSPYVLGRSPTAGGAVAIAVRGDRVYLAEGPAGVGLYDISVPSAPTLLDVLPAPNRDKAVGVAASGTTLAVGLSKGTVWLYDLSASAGVTPAAPALAGSLPARGKLEAVRFVAGQLWVLGKNGSWLQGFDVSEPAAPAVLGTSTADPQWHMRARFSGAATFTFDRRGVQRLAIEPVGP